MFTNKVKEMLEEGKIPIGIVLSQIYSEPLPMLLSSAGYDFVLIDKEHSCFNNETISKLTLQSLGVNLTPFARIPFDDLVSVSQCLDAGLQGIMLPMVESVEQVKKVVERMKYEPRGKRGLSLRNTSTQFINYPIENVIEHSNNQTMLILQIETEKSLNRIEEFASIEGVDVLEIGPWDLSFSLGIPGQFGHPKFLKAIENMIKVSKKNGKWSGIYTDSLEMAKSYINMGINILFYSSDISILIDRPKQDISTLRAI